MKVKHLCLLTDVPHGQAIGCDPSGIGRDTVLVLRVGNQIKAYANSCPHLQVAMEYRKDRFMSADGRYIVCYAHNARFTPEDGKCVYGPCLGEYLQAIDVVVVEGVVMLAGQENAAPPSEASGQA